MEHKGIEYQVVQTANPTGWRWTFELEGKRTRTGLMQSRVGAIYKAEQAIDKILATPGKPA